MNSPTNPFTRGFRNLTYRRVLMVTENDESGLPPLFLPLHPSQAHLPDSRLVMHGCVFADNYVLITEDQRVPQALEDKFPREGIVRMVLYTVEGMEAGRPVHVGDTYSAELARELIERASFSTGHYSRSWEISSDHLNTPAFTYLVERAENPASNDLFFDVFRLETEYSCVGCKLLCTPWTDDGLADHGLTAKALREEQLAAGVPEALVYLLHLAAQADARFLIFDANAPALQGLPLRSEGDYA